MKNFLLGILFTYAVQYGLAAYYSYYFEEYFSNECGVKNGYEGALQPRFDCVYEHMGVMKSISDFVLARPMIDHDKDGASWKVIH